MSGLYCVAWPAFRLLDPETAHGLAIGALKRGLVPSAPAVDSPSLAIRLWDRDFANPIGLAAGFDKNAEVPDAMLGQGFGFVEIGSVTPRPQVGNPKPRLFRLERDRAVINRMGFNNDGLEAVAARLLRRAKGGPGLVGVNLGKNKETTDALDDYLLGVEALAAHADYLVVNVSSPNTEGLRALQDREPLARLLAGVRDKLDGLGLERRPPLLLKVAPDLTDEDKSDIAAVVLDEGVDGLIATNTTVARPDDLRGAHKDETGGLSGKPLMAPSTAVLADFHRLLDGRVPLIGVGGVSSAAEAYAKIRAGASLVQLYTALVYEGPGLVDRIKRGLADLLARDGFATLADAVGADRR